MASRFNALKADAAWQKVWDERKTFAADDSSTKPRSYVLEMFPIRRGASTWGMSGTTRWATCSRGSVG